MLPLTPLFPIQEQRIMLQITLRQIATSLNRDGIESLTLALRQVVIQMAQRHGQSVDEFLDARGLRALYRKVTNYHNLITEFPEGDCEVNPAGVDLLLSCVRRLDISVDQLISNDFRSRPWDSFYPGDTLVTVLGRKLVEGPEKLRQYYVSERDTQAKNALADFLRDQQRLSFRTIEKCLSIEISAEDADAEFQEIRARRDVGMIVAFGSSVVDPLATPMARSILRNAGLEDSPAWLEWPSHPKRRQGDFVADPLLTRSGKQCGVRLATPVITKNGQATSFFPRVGRDEALLRFQQRDPGPYDDAGILMLDITCLPMLCLVAGHGGCGTQAALQALLDDENISRELAASQHGGSVLGPGRVMQVVEVRCMKRTPRVNVDDLEFKAGDWTAHTLRAAPVAA
jgi:hypothetical protein